MCISKFTTDVGAATDATKYSTILMITKHNSSETTAGCNCNIEIINTTPYTQEQRDYELWWTEYSSQYSISL